MSFRGRAKRGTRNPRHSLSRWIPGSVFSVDRLRGRGGSPRNDIEGQMVRIRRPLSTHRLRCAPSGPSDHLPRSRGGGIFRVRGAELLPPPRRGKWPRSGRRGRAAYQHADEALFSLVKFPHVMREFGHSYPTALTLLYTLTREFVASSFEAASRRLRMRAAFCAGADDGAAEFCCAR